MDMPVNVPVDDPNTDTEWNDILRKHGVIPEKPPSPTQQIQEALQEAKRQAHENRLENKTLDELDELEDEEEEEFLSRYRSQRMHELKELSQKARFGHVYPLQKPDYEREVTEGSKDAFVFVHLKSSTASNVESRILSEVWREAALKFGEIKFCEIIADMCIENYPERNVPTILVYKDSDIKEQIITLRTMNGPKTNLKDIQRLLVDVSAITNRDHRVVSDHDSDEKIFSGSNKNRGFNQRSHDEDDDDDWN